MDTALTDWCGEEETSRVLRRFACRGFICKVEDFWLMLAPKRQDTRGFTV
jgi:hypothetical protein